MPLISREGGGGGGGGGGRRGGRGYSHQKASGFTVGRHTTTQQNGVRG